MATPTTLPASFVSGNTLLASQLNDLRGAFRVLQVVQSTLTTIAQTTSTSYVTTGLTATITPSSTSSQILVMYAGTQGAQSGKVSYSTVFRGTTSDTNLGTAQGFTVVYSTAGGTTNSGAGGIILDSPATTSAQVYTVAIKSSGSGSIYWSNETTTSSLTLMEISA